MGCRNRSGACSLSCDRSARICEDFVEFWDIDCDCMKGLLCWIWWGLFMAFCGADPGCRMFGSFMWVVWALALCGVH